MQVLEREEDGRCGQREMEDALTGSVYRLLHGEEFEKLVILPCACHRGFSTGYKLAETINYADAA